MRDVYDKQDCVAAFERVLHLLEHAPVQLRLALVDAGCIDQDDLRGRVAGLAGSLLLERHLEHAEDAGARGLRFVRHDGQLLPQEGVQQRGLPGVGPANDGDKPGAKGHRPLWASKDVAGPVKSVVPGNQTVAPRGQLAG
jgi:hypothetical protein